MMHWRIDPGWLTTALAALLLVAGCSGGPPTVEAPPGADGAAPEDRDAAPSAPDAGPPRPSDGADAGTPGADDAGTPGPIDAGAAPDAGDPDADTDGDGTADDVDPDDDGDGVPDPADAFPRDPARAHGTADTAEVYRIALERWESALVERGRQLGAKLTSRPLSELNAQPRAWYYDSQRVFFQAADYLGDPSGEWDGYAQAAEVAYEAYVQPGYGMPGYERFPHGIALDHLRTGDPESLETLRNLRDRGPFSDATTSPWADGWYQQASSREVAYMLDTHVMAERAGLPRQAEALDLYVDMALGHIEIWTTGSYLTDDASWQFCQSFMTGLTASALIGYYELTVETGEPDERVPAAIETLADWLIERMWVPNHDLDGTYAWVPERYGSFKYVSPAVSGVGGESPAPDLNLLIAPLFGWLHQRTGDARYLEVGDMAFAAGVAFAYLVPDKVFNQSYRSSFDYVRWRARGVARWGG